MEAPVEHLSILADQVMGLMLLILLASMTALLSNRLPRLPYTVALVLVGALLQEFSAWFPALHLLTDFKLTPELVLTLEIPGLLLSTAIIGGITTWIAAQRHGQGGDTLHPI